MNPLKLLLLLLLFTNPFKAMDCFANRTFNKEPLTAEEKNKLLELLRSSSVILDEQQNTVLHIAAALKEYPELVNDILSHRPELKAYLDTPNSQGVTPRNLMLQLQAKTAVPTFSDCFQITIVRLPKQIIATLDKSIEAKMKQSHPAYSILEKVRIVEHIREMVPTKGNTILHLAAGIQGFPELTQRLLVLDPDLKLVLNNINGEGYTALDIASIKENSHAAEALKAAGAKDIL